MNFEDIDHDDALLEEMGRRLAQLRIDRNLTQAELAEKAGVGKRTLERLEAGETTQTRTLFRIFRELDLLKKLGVVLPEPAARPRYAIKQADQLPKRASRKNQSKNRAEEWIWGDEQ